jgi:hypothetical protein
LLLGRLESRGSQFKASTASSLSYSISKITRAKWVGLVPQVVEHLLCKCEGLRSNLNPTKQMLLIILFRFFF